MPTGRLCIDTANSCGWLDDPGDEPGGRVALPPGDYAQARTAIHAVKPAQIATFLGREHKLHVDNTDEIGNDFQTRIQEARIKHHMGPASIKMYDTAGIILRIETTTNNPKWFSTTAR